MVQACGVDFGTSNSSLAVVTEEGPRLRPLQQGETSVPTAVFFSFDDDTTTFGLEAQERYFDRETGRFLRAIKSLLGSELYGETTQVKRKRYAFSDITSAFLRFLRTSAAEKQGDGPRRVVLGRPVAFVDDDPLADALAQSQLADAARAAGFQEIEFQFEPVAAALDYEQSVAAEQVVLVADIGGGTSDFSLVRVSPERSRARDRREDILGSAGIHIGGTDFDRALALAQVMPALGLGSTMQRQDLQAPRWYFNSLASWHKIGFLYEAKVAIELRALIQSSAEPQKIRRLLKVIEERRGHALLAAVEEAKISLSDRHLTTLALEGDLTLEVSRDELFHATVGQLEDLQNRLQDLLRQAGLAASDITALFLTGGTTRMPLVQEAMARSLPGTQLITGDTFGSVAKGLALEAARRFPAI